MTADAPYPTPAERCRTLVEAARTATLSTLAREPEGHPFGSLVAIASDAHGRPLLLLSRLAEHTQNLEARAECSVLFTEIAPHLDADPLALGRVTILGEARRVGDTERASVRERFLARQPRAEQYVDFRDFGFFRIEPRALRWVGGFGRMSWVGADAYGAAAPDPIAPHAAGVVQHMNEDHADAVLAYARALASVDDATSAALTDVDRYGFGLRADTPDGSRTARIAFDAPVATTDEVRKAMISLVRRARGA